MNCSVGSGNGFDVVGDDEGKVVMWGDWWVVGNRPWPVSGPGI